MFENIPQELKKCKNWVVWKYEDTGKSKKSKVPYKPNTWHLKKSLKAKSNDSSSWGSFTDAMESYALSGKYDGIGFMFTPPYIGVDIDNCVVDGNYSDVAIDVLNTVKGYAELSPSGTGIHIITKYPTEIKGRKSSEHGLEVYNNARYFTMTGNVIRSEVLNLQTAEVDTVLDKYFKVEVSTKENTLCRSFELTLSDKEVLTRCKNSTQGKRFVDVFKTGNLSSFDNDASKADFWLCRGLASYTTNAEQIDRIFRKSKLYRDKWDSKRDSGTYGSFTIERAVQAIKERHSIIVGSSLEQDLEAKQSTFEGDTMVMEKRKSCEEKNPIGEFDEIYTINPHMLTRGVPGHWVWLSMG